jgi:hypothetical protein
MNDETSEPVNITCFFYSHSWAVQVLDQIGLGDLSKTLIVEISINSILASVFNDLNSNRRGVAGLLRSDITVDQIVQNFSGLQCPIVLASRPPVPVASTASGVGVLRHAAHGFNRVILMVHLSEAATMIHAVADADRFGVLWDLADTPNVGLADLGIVLTRHNCLSDESWAGLHFYEHPRRKVADAQDRKKRYEQIFAEYPSVLKATA